MATVTIKINDNTKVGQSLINIATELSHKYKSISILSNKDKESPYNPEFVKKVLDAKNSKERIIVEDVNEYLGL